MSDYKMPPVHVGLVVLWYEGGVKNYERSCPAIVQKVQHNSVALKAFGLDVDLRLEHVRHLADPNARDEEKRTDGAWDYCATEKEAES